MVEYGVSGSWIASPTPMVGSSRLAVVSAVQRRPPNTGTMNE